MGERVPSNSNSIAWFLGVSFNGRWVGVVLQKGFLVMIEIQELFSGPHPGPLPEGEGVSRDSNLLLFPLPRGEG